MNEADGVEFTHKIKPFVKTCPQKRIFLTLAIGKLLYGTIKMFMKIKLQTKEALNLEGQGLTKSISKTILRRS